MKTSKIIFSLLFFLCSTAVFGQNGDPVFRDKITTAVLNVYDEHLAQNPGDYNVLFARANQHYYDGDYKSAMADVNKALQLTPKKDKELRFDEYILRARISDACQDYKAELADLKLAREIQPKSLACIDFIAKANLKAGNIDEAEKAFKTILNSESMNFDAMYGMAQVQQSRGNLTAALEQVNKAVSYFPNEPQVYVNRADIFTRQGNISAALQDLLTGMNAGNGGNAAQRLFELSDTHYGEVMATLANLAGMSNDSGLYHYLRASIAMDHSRYGQALKDLSIIKRNNLYNSHLVDYNLAKCYLELGRIDEALDQVERAMAISPNQPEYFLVKSLAQYYAGEGGHVNEAMSTLDRCTAIAPEYMPMLLAKGELIAAQERDKDALGYLNAAVAHDPGDAEARLARALTLKRMGYDQLLAEDMRVLNMLSDDVENMRGVALIEQGRDEEAQAWLDKVTATAMPGGANFINAARLMVMRGDNAKALEYVQKAIDNGYGSKYTLLIDELTPFNLKPLRELPEFKALIERAQGNFVESD